MNPRSKPVRSLWIDRSLTNDAAKGQFQMLGRAAETIVEVEIAPGGIDVVAPQEARDPAPGPHALRRPGGERQPRGCFPILLDLLLDPFFCLLLGRLLVFGLLFALCLVRRLLLPPLRFTITTFPRSLALLDAISQNR